MQHNLLRISIRRLMLVIAFLAMASWLVVTAILVARDPNADQMCHLRQIRDSGAVFVQTHSIDVVFWPRYWRRLLGRPWPGSYSCPSCRVSDERTEKDPVIDIASSARAEEMLQAMDRILRQRHEAEIKAVRERSVR